MQGMSNGAEQWCPVKGGGCILEMSFNDITVQAKFVFNQSVNIQCLSHLGFSDNVTNG